MKYILIVIIASMGCIAQSYFRSSEFHFEVKYEYFKGNPSLDANHTETKGPLTMELHSVENRRAGIMDTVEWVYNEYNLTLYQQRYCVSDSLGIMITSPNKGVFANTENIPNPQVKFPLKIGDSIYVEQALSNGKLMKGYLKVTGNIKYNEGINDHNPWKLEAELVDGHLELSKELNYYDLTDYNDPWRIEAYNLENDNYSAVYYYNEKYGFVYFKYELENVLIEMNFDGRTERGFADENGVKYKDDE